MVFVSSSMVLMAVHAHPDDESTCAGGTLALYAELGVRSIVVSCTGGELGDAAGGAKPGQPGHDVREVAAVRRGELRAACEILGVAAVEWLGYRDSGISDADRPDDLPVFCEIPVPVAAQGLCELIARYRPQVVITHSDNMFQHRDHCRAAAVTRYAVAATGIPAKLYYKIHGAQHWRAIRAALAGAGIRRPEPDAETASRLTELDAMITTTLDVRRYASTKRAALLAHAGQPSFAKNVSAEAFREAAGVEQFHRLYDTTGAPVPETDLFAGIEDG
jgi:LmbE family N-acetylglucosaminyl deacetylase